MTFHMTYRSLTAALCVWIFTAFAAAGQEVLAEKAAEARAEVLVLGLYHMSNPGQDVVNMEADDVLAPRRQAEIAEVIAVLKKFRPTRIAVEAAFSNKQTARRYSDYRAGRHELTRNETEQIGFRLARELGHETVYAVDVSGEFPFPRLVDYAKAHGRTEEFDALMGEITDNVRATNTYLASHTVLETLLMMNSDEHVGQDVGFYYRQAHFSEPWNWAGADLLADWFRRNIRIYANVVGLIRSPDERVLVIFGAGHLGWLRYNFASDPAIRLRKLAEFMKS